MTNDQQTVIRPTDPVGQPLFSTGPFRVSLATRAVSSRYYGTPYRVTDQRRDFGDMTLGHFPNFESAVQAAEAANGE